MRGNSLQLIRTCCLVLLCILLAISHLADPGPQLAAVPKAAAGRRPAPKRRRRAASWTPPLRVAGSGGPRAAPGRYFVVPAASAERRVGRRLASGERVLARNSRTGQQGLAILWPLHETPYAGAGASAADASTMLCGRWDGCPVASRAGDWRAGDRLEMWGGQPGPHAYAGYVRELVSRGSRRVGTVNLLPQLHPPPGGLPAARRKRRLREIMSSQEAIYRFLCARRPRHVFAEGCELMLRQTQESLAGTGNRYLAKVLAAFEGYRHQDSMNKLQCYLCTQIRAPTLYALLHSGVSLHPADDLASLQAHADALAAVRSLGAAGTDAFVAAEMTRELKIKDRLEAFFSKHPGENVMLVYGAMHYFVCMEEWAHGPRVYRHHLSGFNPAGDPLRQRHLQSLTSA